MDRCCCYKFCDNKYTDSKFRCSVCKAKYCSRKCQKLSWRKHKKYCNVSYIERMVSQINDMSFFGDRNRIRSNEVGNYRFFTSVSCESIFGFNNIHQESYYCVFCQKAGRPMFYKCSLDDKNSNNAMLYYYSTCVQCNDINLHRTCTLPHDERQECPLIKRYYYLLLCFPLLKELPLDIRKMLFKITRQDFMNYLIN
jgi:hypothetical protein